jgi:ACR3 family arsenite transporter
MNPLALAARAGPWVLVGGLVAGVVLPGPASFVRGVIPEMVVALLFLAIVRMDPAEIARSLRALPATAAVAVLYQLALPCAVFAVASALGQAGSPVPLALVLMTAAPSITGSPSISVMLGVSPLAALRLLVAGTALLPLTVIPVFWLLPSLEGASVVPAALRLFALVAGATALAVAVRLWLWPTLSARAMRDLEGGAAILLAVFVVGLMAAVGETLRRDPWEAAFWCAVAAGANLGLQLAVWVVVGRRLPRAEGVPLSLIAGNRNIALFLASLDPALTAPILTFIGFYQFPMYLTPLILRRLYR